MHKIFNQILKPYRPTNMQMTPEIILAAIAWAYKTNHSDLKNICDSINGDDCYIGALLYGIVDEYVRMKEREGD